MTFHIERAGSSESARFNSNARSNTNARHKAKARRFPIIWIILGSVIALCIFSAIFEIDQAVRAQGQVIPGARTQVIQVVDGGVLKEISVREGDEVVAGQLLAVLASQRAQASESQSQGEVASRRMALLRAKAELAGQVPHFGNEFADYPEFVAAQQGLYQQRKRGLEEELAAQQQSLALASDELAVNERLLKTGDVGRAEVTRSQRQVLEVQARMTAIRNKYLQDTRQEIARLEDDLATSSHKLEERKDILAQTELRAPLTGIVKVVRISTVGGVLRPGDELMQISPTDENVLVELKVNPADVGQLRNGLPVSLRFDAFDSSIYGSVPGTLGYISPDTLVEQGGGNATQVYYRAHVVLDWKQREAMSVDRAPLRAADIKPGMTATADILTGHRSLWHYLTKPVNRAFSGAMIER